MTPRCCMLHAVAGWQPPTLVLLPLAPLLHHATS